MATRFCRPLFLPLLVAACTTPPEPDAATPKKADATPTAPTTPSAPPAPTPTPTVTPPTNPAVAPTPPLQEAEPEVVAEVAQGFNAFGVELYRIVAEANPGDAVISPASIAMAFAMTHAGARGETAKEIAETLHYPRAAPIVQRAVATILTDYNTPSDDAVLSVANRLFGDKAIAYETPFLNLSNRFFRAPLEPLDFSGAPEPARTRINDWVSEKTRDRIKDLLPAGSITSSTKLALVNAIYFKAPWQDEFNESATAPAPFFTTAQPHDVATMHATRHFSFMEDDAVQVVQLPYRDSRFAMTVIVPKKVDGLAEVESSLTAEQLDGWHTPRAAERIKLSMPKFRIAPAQSTRLASTLSELGIVKAFGGEADLTGIAPAKEELQLSEAFHKGFIAVDEKGTEAAAATAVVARAGSAMPTKPPREVKVDRPFLYIVRDKNSGLVLFMGRVVDPKVATAG